MLRLGFFCVRSVIHYSFMLMGDTYIANTHGQATANGMQKHTVGESEQGLLYVRRFKNNLLLLVP